MIALVINKQMTLAGVVEATGIRNKSFWFTYILNLLKDNSERYTDFLSLSKIIDEKNRLNFIRELKQQHGIDGSEFDINDIIVVNEIKNVDFTSVKSRKIKVIEI